MRKQYPSALSLIPSTTMLLLSVAALVLAMWSCGLGPETSSESAAGAPAATSNAVQAGNRIDTDGIDAADLPSEAHHALQLIKKGGPFPYAKDGAVFGNRERLLIAKPHGYYREYTVKTPGARDRGARRIIAGENGEFYYTDDHYSSFKRIRE
jgi:ribonuclease T1